MKTIARYKKAIAGLIGPAVVTFVYAVQAGSPGGTSVTGGEWALIVVAALGTGATVAAAPKNRDSRGAVSLVTVLVVVVLVLLLLWLIGAVR